MKMQLVSLTLENFKCHEHLEIRFDGRNAAIYGQNAAGKSSIYDGLTWLLFGKDSHGKKDFDIKPLTLEGNVKDHHAITSVEAVLLVDGVERKLKRTYYEIWSTKRGSAEDTFDGHSSGYFVDDVPCKKNEFVRRVGEIIDENAFRLLTSITYFAAELPWQERRAALFDVAAVATDEEILASDAQFAPLATAMQGLTLDDFRKKLAVQRKGLNNVRNDTPARLDECKKTVADLSGIDFPALERQRAETQERRAATQRELDQAEQDGGRTELRNKLAGIAFMAGSLSMVGMPMFSGFISKLFFAQAAVGHAHKMFPTFIALAISTILNAIYFMKTVIRIYTPMQKKEGVEGEAETGRAEGRSIPIREQPVKSAALICFIVLNLMLGLNSDPLIRLIQSGIEMFD